MLSKHQTFLCAFFFVDGQLSKGSEAGWDSGCLDTEWSAETKCRANQRNRTGRNRWSLANTGWTVFETTGVSLASQQPKISKTLLRWYIWYKQVCVCISKSFFKGIMFLWTPFCSTSVEQAGLLGGKWLLIELEAVETAGPGREEENTIILTRQGGKANRETGSVAWVQQYLIGKYSLALRRWTGKKRGSGSYWNIYSSSHNRLW